MTGGNLLHRMATSIIGMFCRGTAVDTSPKVYRTWTVGSPGVYIPTYE
jgi:hypothetical protein